MYIYNNWVLVVQGRFTAHGLQEERAPWLNDLLSVARVVLIWLSFPHKQLSHKYENLIVLSRPVKLEEEIENDLKIIINLYYETSTDFSFHQQNSAALPHLNQDEKDSLLAVLCCLYQSNISTAFISYKTPMEKLLLQSLVKTYSTQNFSSQNIQNVTSKSIW